jgi:hypothetical protein
MRKTVRGLPLLAVLIIGLVSMGVLGAAFSAWVLTNSLTLGTPPPTTYTGETKTFTISMAGEDDMILVTVTLTGEAKPNAIVNVVTKLEITKPSWRLYGGAKVYLDIKLPDNTLLITITNTTPAGLGKGASPSIEFTNTFTTGSATGAYTITPRMDTMTWVQPA